MSSNVLTGLSFWFYFETAGGNYECATAENLDTQSGSIIYGSTLCGISDPPPVLCSLQVQNAAVYQFNSGLNNYVMCSSTGVVGELSLLLSIIAAVVA